MEDAFRPMMFDGMAIPPWKIFFAFEDGVIAEFVCCTSSKSHSCCKEFADVRCQDAGFCHTINQCYCTGTMLAGGAVTVRLGQPGVTEAGNHMQAYHVK